MNTDSEHMRELYDYFLNFYTGRVLSSAEKMSDVFAELGVTVVRIEDAKGVFRAIAEDKRLLRVLEAEYKSWNRVVDNMIKRIEEGALG